MSDSVKVDPVSLRMSADHLIMHGDDLRRAHAESDADIEATSAGWVGESAMAIRIKVSEWQRFTEKMCADLDTHKGNFRSAADAYEATDADSAQAITSQTPSD